MLWIQPALGPCIQQEGDAVKHVGGVTSCVCQPGWPCLWWPNRLSLSSVGYRSRNSILCKCRLSRLLLKTWISRIIGNWSSLQPDETLCFRRRSDLHLPGGMCVGAASLHVQPHRLFCIRDRDKGFSWDRGKCRFFQWSYNSGWYSPGLGYNFRLIVFFAWSEGAHQVQSQWN